MSENLKIILTALEYADSQGLVLKTDPNDFSCKMQVFNTTKTSLNIDAMYFIRNVPVVLFKNLEKNQEQELPDFLLKCWNYGNAPLVFVTMDNEQHLYSANMAPVQKNGQWTFDHALLASNKTAISPQTITKNFGDFSRMAVDSGDFLKKHLLKLYYAERVDHILIESLKKLSTTLIEDGLSFEHTYNLLSRTIMLLYLRDKGVITESFLHSCSDKITSFEDVFKTKTVAYKIFQTIFDKLGKDFFPISADEKKAIKASTIKLLRETILGKNTDGNAFLLFNFNIIPAETVCSAYEELLYSQGKDTEGASYTPPALAKLMLDQILPDCKISDSLKILDPACGSSIFLIQAFKRILHSKVLEKKSAEISIKEMYEIIQQSLFACDIQEEGLKFTSFCLLLAVLESVKELDLETIEPFPLLIGKNFVQGDFFDEKTAIHKHSFDVIVGNPPWQSNYGEKAKKYLANHDHPVGDKQTSQVFLWHAGDLINETGQICFLMPSKGLLYNFNPRNVEFREKFFKTFDVTKVINLSLFSNLLFENSKFPASIVQYSLIPQGKEPSKSLEYSTPKPAHKGWEYAVLTIDSANIKKIPKSQIFKNKHIWKIAFVGSGRDYSLLNYLDKNFEKIDSICEKRQWKYGEGFQLGGGDKNINNSMSKMLYIPAKSIYPFFVNKTELEKLGKNTFHRPRDPDLYKAPHTVVRGGQIFAAYLDYNAVFTHAVMSFAGSSKEDAPYLKLLAAYLNSSLALYYLFLTSSTWCIERTDIHLGEYITLPFTLGEDKELLNNILNEYDKLSASVGDDTKAFEKNDTYLEHRNQLDTLIFDLFKLDNNQRKVVLDTTSSLIPYFQIFSKSLKSKDVDKYILQPDEEELKSYAQAFMDNINPNIRKFKHKVKSTIYKTNQALTVAAFSIVPMTDKADAVTLKTDKKSFTELIHKLDSIVIKQTQESIYLKKNIRIFEGDTVYLVKPSEKRHWSNSMALNDSDRNIKEILKGF